MMKRTRSARRAERMSLKSSSRRRKQTRSAVLSRDSDSLSQQSSPPPSKRRRRNRSLPTLNPSKLAQFDSDMDDFATFLSTHDSSFPPPSQVKSHFREQCGRSKLKALLHFFRFLSLYRKKTGKSAGLTAPQLHRRCLDMVGELDETSREVVASGSVWVDKIWGDIDDGIGVLKNEGFLEMCSGVRHGREGMLYLNGMMSESEAEAESEPEPESQSQSSESEVEDESEGNVGTESGVGSDFSSAAEEDEDVVMAPKPKPKPRPKKKKRKRRPPRGGLSHKRLAELRSTALDPVIDAVMVKVVSRRDAGVSLPACLAKVTKRDCVHQLLKSYCYHKDSNGIATGGLIELGNRVPWSAEAFGSIKDNIHHLKARNFLETDDSGKHYLID